MEDPMLFTQRFTLPGDSNHAIRWDWHQNTTAEVRYQRLKRYLATRPGAHGQRCARSTWNELRQDSYW